MANTWLKAVAAARKKLNVKGFMPIKKGTPLYTEAKKIQSTMKGGGAAPAAPAAPAD